MGQVLVKEVKYIVYVQFTASLGTYVYNFKSIISKADHLQPQCIVLRIIVFTSTPVPLSGNRLWCGFDCYCVQPCELFLSSHDFKSSIFEA